MTISHLKKLRAELERRHWVIVGEQTHLDDGPLEWTVARPNGDSCLRLQFCPGHGGPYGDVQLETIEESIGVRVVEHIEVGSLYFGSKYQGKFQADVVAFADAIDGIDK